MRFVIVYLSTAAVMLPLDFAFLSTIGKKLFEREVPDMLATSPRLAPAILFYLIYLGGIVALVNGASTDDWRHNLLHGAVLGVTAYATFELTNLALLRHWTWSVVIPDLVWGAVVKAAAASLGGLIAARMLSRIA